MIDFTTTNHCRSHLHCNACRNDPAWRAAMAKSFVMPDKCPYDGPNGRKVYRVPDNAADICRECEKPISCPNVTSCCGGKITITLRSPCPKGLWKMIEE